METARLLFDDPVARTLLIPLWAKAQEHQQANSLFEDRQAIHIVNSLPQNALSFSKAVGVQTGTVVRVHLFDQITRQFINDHKNPVIVHIGCGLDDRFGRTDKGTGIQVNIDLPEVINLREQLIESGTERNPCWEGSLLETGWMDRLLGKYPEADFCFFCEGVLMYFQEENVKNLMSRIAERFPKAHIWFDSVTSFMIKRMNRTTMLKEMNAPFKWALNDPAVIEQWHPQIKHIGEHNYMLECPRRWGRFHLLRFFPFRMIAKGARINGYQIES